MLTPYDKSSVMHYQIDKSIDPTNVSSECMLLGGDNFETGPTNWDQLGVRFMYPSSARIAEFRGDTVAAAGRGPLSIVGNGVEAELHHPVAAHRRWGDF